MILNSSPTLKIAHDDVNWKIETKTTMSAKTVAFKIGEEFKEETGKGVVTKESST
jgi:hypothetical protein